MANPFAYDHITRPSLGPNQSCMMATRPYGPSSNYVPRSYAIRQTAIPPPSHANHPAHTQGAQNDMRLVDHMSQRGLLGPR